MLDKIIRGALYAIIVGGGLLSGALGAGIQGWCGFVIAGLVLVIAPLYLLKFILLAGKPTPRAPGSAISVEVIPSPSPAREFRASVILDAPPQEEPRQRDS